MTLRQWVDAAAKAGLATKAALLDFETGLIEASYRAHAAGAPGGNAVFADISPELWEMHFRMVCLFYRRLGLPPLGGRS